MVVEGMKALRGIMSMVRNSFCLSVCSGYFCMEEFMVSGSLGF